MAVGLAASGTTPLKARWRRLIGRFLFTIGAHLYAWMTWQPTWRGHCGELADLFPTQGPNGQRLRVLDLGIGPGISGIGIVDRRPAAFVLGLDYSAVMLRLAQRRLRQTKVEVSLLRGDGMANRLEINSLAKALLALGRDDANPGASSEQGDVESFLPQSPHSFLTNSSIFAARSRTASLFHLTPLSIALPTAIVACIPHSI